jgi:glutathione S-transferase
MTDKLYYSPVANYGAASFVAAFIGGVEIPCETVDVLEKKTLGGQDYTSICKKGALPCLVTSRGECLTEEPVILEYIADKVRRIVAFFECSIDLIPFVCRHL